MTPALSDAAWTEPEILNRVIEDDSDRAALLAACGAADAEPCSPSPPSASPRLVRVRATPLLRVPFWIRADQPGDAERLMAAVTSAGHAPPVKLSQAPLMLVVGAHIGSACRQLLATYPGASLVAVEALESNAALCRRNLDVWNEHERRAGRLSPLGASAVIEAAVWSEPGPAQIGGPSPLKARMFEAGTAQHPSTPLAGVCEAMTMRSLVDRVLAERRRRTLGYVLMHISGSEGMVFESDLSWLYVVEVLRVRVSPPSSIERVMHQIAGADMVVRRCPRDACSVIAWSRSAAERAALRGPRLETALQPPPPPI